MVYISWLIFLQDLNSAYSGKVLSPLKHDHLDFSMTQRKAIQNGELRIEIDFWKEELPDVPGPLKLFPFSRVESRSTMTEYDTHTFDMEIDADLMAQIKKRALGCVLPHFISTCPQSSFCSNHFSRAMIWSLESWTPTETKKTLQILWGSF